MKKSYSKTELGKNNIRNIIFEDINDDYSWGNYGDFKVIVMKSNGYINATELCKNATTKTGSKKGFREWKRTINSLSIIKIIHMYVGIPTDYLLIKISTGQNATRGTYAHPDLIPHIASWASTEFAYKVSKIINQYYIDIEIERKDKLIKKKNDKIDELSNKIDKLLHKNDKINHKLKRLLTKNDDLYDKNEEILNKINEISNNEVVLTGNENDEHKLIIIKNNDDPDDYDDDALIYEYQALRVMKKSINKRIIDHQSRHENMEILMTIDYSPNSMNLWHRIKTKLGNKKIIIDNCKFKLKKRYTEGRLIDDIKEIHQERYNNNIRN
jgi:HEPN domain-containing protein